MKFVTYLAAGLLFTHGAIASNPANEELLAFLKKQSQVKLSKKQLNQLTNRGVANAALFLKACRQDELQVFEIESDLLPAWRAAWLQNDAARFAKVTGADAALKFRPKLGAAPSTTFDDISVYNWSRNAELSAAALLAEFGQLEHMELAIVDYSVPFEQRDERMRFDAIEALVSFDLVGTGKKADERREERGLWRVLLKKTANAWKMTGVEIVSGETLLSTKRPGFTMAQDEMGLGKLPTMLRTEAIRRGGYALAVGDVNNDGKNDFLVAYRDGLSLFTTNASGALVDTTEGSGLESLKYVKTAIFSDLKNNGNQDLLVTVLDPAGARFKEGASSVLVFRNDGKGRFTKENHDFGTKRGFLQPMPATLGDFNRDGSLDFYIGYPGTRDFSVLTDPKQEGPIQGLYMSDGKGGFKDFPDMLDVKNDPNNRNHQKLYPHASLAADVDQNGFTDLLLVDDRNNLSPVYFNKAGKLKTAGPELGLGNKGYGMSIAVGDINNDGITDVIWTNVNFVSAERAALACNRMWNFRPLYTEPGLRILLGQKTGAFVDITEASGVKGRAGFGGAGVSLLDYNNDGYMDIYLTNGLWTGSPEGQELSTLFTALAMDREEYRAMHHVLNNDDRWDFKGVLRGTQGKVLIDGRISAEKNLFPSLGGNQRNRLFRNNKDGTFTEVGFFEGLDSTADGYITGTNINADGNYDLALRNADPGSEAINFPVFEYFRNTGAKDAKAIVLKLQGTRSNRDAIGSFVVAHYDDNLKQVQHVIANSGSMQSDRKLRFLPKIGESKLRELEVHWVSGKVEKLAAPAAGMRIIREK